MDKITHINFGGEQLPKTPMEHMNLGEALLQLESQKKIESVGINNDLLWVLSDSYLVVTKKHPYGGFDVYNLTTEEDLLSAVSITKFHPTLNKVFILPKEEFTDPQQIPSV